MASKVRQAQISAQLIDIGVKDSAFIRAKYVTNVAFAIDTFLLTLLCIPIIYLFCLALASIPGAMSLSGGA